MITYEQAFKDHAYLWETYAAAADMTGGYVDQEDLARMLRKPTKNTARKCLCNQIQHWFSAGTDDDLFIVDDAIALDSRLMEIADRHGIGN